MSDSSTAPLSVRRAPTRRQLLGAAGLLALAGGAWVALGPGAAATVDRNAFPFRLSDGEWRRRLSPMQYYVLRQAGTEPPFAHPLNREHRAGIFACAGCALPLFASTAKYDSGSGWPSFTAPLPRAIRTARDHVLGYPRTEVHCRRCGGHLGHVFEDGPPPRGERWCMNGAALRFLPA